MSAEKAADMVVSGNDEKKEKGLEWIRENPDEGYHALISRFAAGISKDPGRKGQPPVVGDIFDLICRTPDLTDDQICLFMSGCLKRSPAIFLDEEKIPEDFFARGRPGILSALHDNNEDVRKRALDALCMTDFPEETLDDILPMISKEETLCENAMKVLPHIQGDLTPAADALYGLLNVHPYGETAYKIIISLKDRLPCDADAMKKLLDDTGSRGRKKAVAVALAYSESDDRIYDLLAGAVRKDEDVRGYVIDYVEKKEVLSEADMDMAWDALVFSGSDFTISRALRVLPTQGRMSLSLFLYQIRNGDRRSLVYALRCFAAMKERKEFAGKSSNPLNDPDDMKQASSIALSDLADVSGDIFGRIDISDYPHLGNFLKQRGAGFKESERIAEAACDRCRNENVPVPPEILSSLGPDALAATVDEAIRKIFASYGRGYDDDFSEKFTAGLEDILLIDKTIIAAAVKAAGYAFTLNGYTNEIRISSNDANAAVNRLRTIRNPAADNILNLISRKKDLMITVCPENGSSGASEEAAVVRLSFESQRETADAELERRGFPVYSPKAYLRNRPRSFRTSDLKIFPDADTFRSSRFSFCENRGSEHIRPALRPETRRLFSDPSFFFQERFNGDPVNVRSFRHFRIPDQRNAERRIIDKTVRIQFLR